MAEVTSGLYKIILEQSYQDQVVLNTFFYLENLGNDDEQELAAQAFDEDILTVLDSAQHTTLDYTAIRAVNVTGSLADFVRTPTTTSGSLTGTPLNSFTCAGIRLNRTTKETRNGQKRFSGLTEEVVIGNELTSSYQTTLGTVGTALSTDISTVGLVAKPVIAREKAGSPGTWIVNDVASASVNQFVTTQVSRKQGRGD